MSRNAQRESVTEQLISQVGAILPIQELTKVSIVVAVSGGSDSVALAHMLATQSASDRRPHLAHFNHQLRGAEADEDEQWVRELADQLDCPLIVGHPDAPILAAPGTSSKQSAAMPRPDETTDEPVDGYSHRGQGPESLARAARYRFLQQTAMQTGSRYVVTAHTWDDQIETIVYRIFRGTGLRGLTGIPAIRQWTPGISLVRPLLNCSKEFLREYLAAHQLSFREDSSNRSDRFARNRIRRELLPLARQILENDPEHAIDSLKNQVEEIVESWEPELEAMIESHVRIEPERVTVRLDQELLDRPRYWINEVWIRIWSCMNWPRQQMNREKWNLVSELAQTADSRKINLPGNLLAERHADHLVIWRGGARDD